jgi:TRAP-type transport system small permease protein
MQQGRSHGASRAHGLRSRFQGKAVLKKIITVLDMIQVTLFAGLVVLSFSSVFSRYVLNNSLTWAEEITRYMFIWLVYLGAALCIRRRKHIVMDLFISELKGAPKKVLSIINNLVMLAFVLVLATQAFGMMPILSSQTSTALHIPMSFVYGAVPVGAVLMAFYLVLDCILIVQDRLPEDEGSEKSEEVAPDAI